MRHHPLLALVVLIACVSCVRVPVAGRCHTDSSPVAAPRIDHHQHLLSPAGLQVTLDWLRARNDPYHAVAAKQPTTDAAQLVGMLDAAGIARAVVFSNAYHFTRGATEQPGEQEGFRAESDWTLAQVRRFPGRFHVACSVNPLRSWAVDEVERCAASGDFVALKVHFDASGVDVTDAEHLARVRRTFAAANRLRLPIVVHLQAEPVYGGAEARIFLADVLPQAPDVPVTVNHLWGGGQYTDGAAEALGVYADAFVRRDPVTANLWFDVAQASMIAFTERNRAEVALRMRQIGFARLLYGSDGPQWSGAPPKQHWEEFRDCMPLTRAELEAIAGNLAPYLR